MPRPHIIVCGDIVQTGGQDRALYALARHMLDTGNELHVVAHRIADDLAACPNMQFHRVRKPANSYMLGYPLIDWNARRLARVMADRRPGILVNGGNCKTPAVNWVHYVHAAWNRRSESRMRTLRLRMHGMLSRHDERVALGMARHIVANSNVTRRDLVERLGIPEQRISVIYYSADPAIFRPPTPAEREAARRTLELTPEDCAIGFVGALNDNRKGFDNLLEGFHLACQAWNGRPLRLLAAGRGGETEHWQRSIRERGLEGRVRFLGFRSDIVRVLHGLDAMAAPSRYEAYGLVPHEAVACGLPAIVTRITGFAERMQAFLPDLLLDSPDDPQEMASAIRRLADDLPRYADLARQCAEHLALHSWDDMARQISQLMEDHAG